MNPRRAAILTLGHAAAFAAGTLLARAAAHAARLHATQETRPEPGVRTCRCGVDVADLNVCDSRGRLFRHGRPVVLERVPALYSVDMHGDGTVHAHHRRTRSQAWAEHVCGELADQLADQLGQLS